MTVGKFLGAKEGIRYATYLVGRTATTALL